MLIETQKGPLQVEPLQSAGAYPGSTLESFVDGYPEIEQLVNNAVVDLKKRQVAEFGREVLPPIESVQHDDEPPRVWRRVFCLS